MICWMPLGAERCLVVPVAERDRAGADYQAVPPVFAIAQIDHWLSDPGPRAHVLGLYEALRLPLPTGFGDEPAERIHLFLRPWLEDALRRGDLVVLTPRRGEPDAPRGRPLPVPVEPEPPPPWLRRTFIAIELVDETGALVPGRRYRITLPDGTVRSGALDGDGAARLDGIEPGHCDVELPDIDGREWRPQGQPRPDAGGASPIASHHTVEQGDSIASIAAKHGFSDWRTVHLHPANEALRERRPSPELLFEGDVVAIPEKQPRKEDAVTARMHRYVLSRAPRFLRIHLRDVLGEPVVNARYTLIIDGATVAEGAVTTSEGLVEQEIHVSARRGRLLTDDYAWDLDVAYLNPVEHAPDQGISGAQGRLLNLGYDVGPVDGLLGARTRAAVRRFQGDQALPATGELDPATIAKLVESHGC